MLFARFLAENDLLVEPERGVAINLQECEDLARDRGIESWELAGQFAQHMLPQIFRPDDPALRLSLPRENRGKLQGLLEELPAVVFRADDSLGWVYQFWQAEKKHQVNRSETKIGADELPSVTQLFTEDYMVLFLLHNTLGAWWAGKVLAERPELASKAKSEDELRKACAVGDVTWPYLRFVREDNGPWRPAAGAFDGWPKAAKEITVLDPCMGSGHFLVFAFPILVALRIAEEGLSREAAVDAILRDNLFGLEIDARCTQIAAFYLALAAWRVVGHRPLPRLNLACSGLSLGVSKAEWLKLAQRAAAAAPVPPDRDLLGSRDNLFSARVKTGLERLYDLFAKAPWLGSLIDPRRSGGDVFAAGFSDIEPFLAPILAANGGGDEIAEMAVAAQGMSKAAELLGRQFDLVATNVPYLGRGKQDEIVKDFCESQFPNAKADLAICMLERCINFVKSGGATAIVTPQNWLFLNSYSKFRKKLLREETWSLVAKLGANAFQDMNWWAAITLLAVFQREQPREGHKICGLDVGYTKDRLLKATHLSSDQVINVPQRSQLSNPQNTIVFEDLTGRQLLKDVARSVEGLSTGDSDRFLQKFWEISPIERHWSFYHTTSDQTQECGGLSELIFWNSGAGELSRSDAARIQGHYAWGKKGVLVSKMNKLKCSLYFGLIHDKMSAALIPENPDDVPAIWAFCSSDAYHEAVRNISQKVDVATNTLAHVPFDREHWQREFHKRYPKGLPKPQSSDPASFLFSGQPMIGIAPLQAAVGRLLGYSWPRQTGSSFPDCPALGADGLEEYADADGIVCIPAVRGEEPAGDRLGALIAAAFGAEWSPAMERQLIAATGSKTASLNEWLRNDFFAQHCALFVHRPFVWHVWDGRKDGFHTLVNYHKLAEGGGKGRRLLETLTYSYLGDWISRQKAAVGQGVAGADDRLAASIELQKELEKIIAGEPPYDIFVRWKPLHEQPIGWEPDVNDGVRLNIRPFVSATLSRGRSGAGVLRAKPNIKWQKDRGKEPGRDRDDYPWFWNGEKFTGERHNDLHFTNAEKRAARQRRGAG